jgi:hypothetical protein
VKNPLAQKSLVIPAKVTDMIRNDDHPMLRHPGESRGMDSRLKRDG